MCFGSGTPRGGNEPPPRARYQTPTSAPCASLELLGGAWEAAPWARRAQAGAFAVRPAHRLGATPPLRASRGSAPSALACRGGGARREPSGWSAIRRGGGARAQQRSRGLRVRARPRPAAALCGSGVGARHGGGRGQAGPDPDLNASISLRAVGLAAGCA